MIRILSIILATSVSHFAFTQSDILLTIDYSTTSDSALAYFDLGWRQIMNEGRWTESEHSFRRAVEVDPNFLIGKSLVGRISHDLKEREAIVNELKSRKDEISLVEQKLLEVYLGNIERMNNRDTGKEIKAEVVVDKRKETEKIFRSLVQAYPDETFVKAEYIELLHAMYGPNTALDSLLHHVSERPPFIPFMISYEATLLAELGKFQEALEKARLFKQSLDSGNCPEEFVVMGNIYFQMGRLNTAREYITKAISLDSRHLIALSILVRIEKATEAEEHE